MSTPAYTQGDISDCERAYVLSRAAFVERHLDACLRLHLRIRGETSLTVSSAAFVERHLAASPAYTRADCFSVSTPVYTQGVISDCESGHVLLCAAFFERHPTAALCLYLRIRRQMLFIVSAPTFFLSARSAHAIQPLLFVYTHVYAGILPLCVYTCVYAGRHLSM